MVPIGNTTGTSYDDTTAVNGQTHHYRVVAENGVGAGEPSAAVTASPTAASGPDFQAPSGGLDTLVLGAIAALIIAAVLGTIFFLRRRRI